VNKKLLLALVCIFVFSGFVHAQRDSTFQVGAAFLVAMPASGGGSIIGGGVNLAGIHYFNNLIGLGTFTDFTYGITGGVSHLIIDALIGPVFRVINTDRFTLPLAAGLFFDYIYAFASGASANGFNIGAGANVTAQYRLGQKFYLYGRVQFGYAFLDGGEMFLTPSIGIGF
jgi:hypothetical protein